MEFATDKTLCEVWSLETIIPSRPNSYDRLEGGWATEAGDGDDDDDWDGAAGYHPN